jgi:hypothetical protein
MSGLTLYELTAERLALQSKLTSMDFDEETIADTLEGSSADIKNKMEDCGYVILNIKAHVKAIEEEESRLYARRKSAEKNLENIISWLLSSMIACNIKKEEFTSFTISTRKCPSTAIIDDEEKIPDEFLTVPDLPAPVPDKRKILAALKSGEEISGVHLEENKQNLSIK